MSFPLISEYIEAIKSAGDNFEELSYLRPVLGDDGLPVMTSGNFAVVFKMQDIRNGKQYAVKCFTKEQEGRADSYKLITDELEFVSSNYLIPVKYLEKELFVDTEQTDENEFPVLLMDWVEGKTLDRYIIDNSENKFLLELLAFQFGKLSIWLLTQSFAHGDLKPENIIVKNDGSIVLIDYDGMYVPAMKGQKARELGSPNYRHPFRTDTDFDEHIDDFPIAVILLSLKAFSINPSLFNINQQESGLLLNERDYYDISDSEVFAILNKMLADIELCKLLGLFLVTLSQKELSPLSFSILGLEKPRISKSQCSTTKEKDDKFIDYDTIKLCIERKEYTEAYRIITMQENLKDKYCQNLLGCFYARGIVVEQNLDKAAYWFRASAEQGLGIAQFNLGNCYYLGRGIAQSYSLADYWYARASKQGVKLAQEMKTYVSTGFSKKTEMKQNIERWRKIASYVYQA